MNAGWAATIWLTVYFGSFAILWAAIGEKNAAIAVIFVAVAWIAGLLVGKAAP